MSFNVTIGLNDETLTALNALTAAIKALGAGAVSAAPSAAVIESSAKETSAALAKAEEKPAAKATTKAKVEEEAEEEAVTIYWFSSASNTVGIVDSEEAFKALKKKDPKTVKYTEAKYKSKLAELEAAAEEAEEEEAAEEDDAPAPTEKDIIAVFGAYLPADLDDDEKAERRPFVKAILDRFGAKKATALPEEHRRLAINLVQRKMAGEDVDVENDEFQEVDEDGLV